MLSEDQTKQLALQDFATMRDQISTNTVDQQWGAKYGFSGELDSNLLAYAKRQFLMDLRNRLTNMMGQQWDNKTDFERQIPEIDNPVGYCLQFIDDNPDLVDSGAIYTEWRQALNANYNACAQNSYQCQWWLDHRVDVQAYVQASSPSLQTCLSMLGQLQQHESLDIVLDQIGLVPAELASAPTAISPAELAYHGTSYLQNLGLVDRIVNDQLLAEFGKYAHQARRALQTDIEDAYRDITGQIVHTFAPEGLNGKDATQQEDKFFEQHLTLAAVQQRITAMWIMTHFAHGNTDPLKYAFVRDLNAAAHEQLQSVYPHGIPTSLQRLNFLSPVLRAEANELPTLIQLFMASGIVAVAQQLHFHEDDLAGDAKHSAFDATTILVEQQAQDWHEALSHLISELDLGDYQDAVEEALAGLKADLANELKTWQATHADQLANVFNQQDLNSLLALDQVHFLNASLIYQRMRQQNDWTPVARQAAIVGVNNIRQMDPAAIAFDVETTNSQGELTGQAYTTFVEHLGLLLSSGILDEQVKQLYASRSHDLADLSELIDIPAGVLYVALNPGASKTLASALGGGEQTMTDEEIEQKLSKQLDSIAQEAGAQVANDYGYPHFVEFLQHCAEEMKPDYLDVLEAKLGDSPTAEDLTLGSDAIEWYTEYIADHFDEYGDDLDSYFDADDLCDQLESPLDQLSIDDFRGALGDDPAYGDDQPSGIGDDAEIDYSAAESEIRAKVDDAIGSTDLESLEDLYKVATSGDTDDIIEEIFGDWDNAAEQMVQTY